MNYLKKEIFNPQRYEEDRARCVTYRSGAISVAFDELDGIINKSAIARDYFHKSQSWFSQRLNNAHVCRSDVSFTEPEARQLASAFRDIARRLNGLASEIETAAATD